MKKYKQEAWRFMTRQKKSEKKRSKFKNEKELMEMLEVLEDENLQLKDRIKELEKNQVNSFYSYKIEPGIFDTSTITTPSSQAIGASQQEAFTQRQQRLAEYIQEYTQTINTADNWFDTVSGGISRRNSTGG